MNREKGIAHLAIIVMVVVALGVLTFPQLRSEPKFSNTAETGLVLSDDDSEDSGSGKNDSDDKDDNRGSSNNGSDDVNDDTEDEEDDERGERNSLNTRVRIRELDGEGESEIEIEDDSSGTGSSSFKIKTKTKDGVTKVFFRDENAKVKFVFRQGESVLELESEDGETEEIDEVEAEEFENEFEDETGIDIETDEENEELLFSKNGVRARTHFPLTIGPNNELIVTTPAGAKVVTILPDVAVKNMILNSGVTRVDLLPGETPLPSATPEESPGATGSPNPSETPSPTESGEPSSTPEATPEPVESTIELIELEDGRLAYEIDGISDQNLLGIIPIELKIKYFVSAQDGGIITDEQTLITRILDLLSV